MNLELPAPGSVWVQKRYSRPMRAVLVDHQRIVAHDCELTAEMTCPMVSWSGTPEQFEAAFVPAGQDHCFPPTAK